MTANRIQLTVSVTEDHLGRFGEVVEAVRKAGLEVEFVLDSLGVITGSAAPSRIEAIRRVPGVAHVEQAREFHIAPPESDVQ